MIKKKGKVIISEDEILVTGFHFTEECDLALCQVEALQWVYSKIRKGLTDLAKKS